MILADCRSAVEEIRDGMRRRACEDLAAEYAREFNGEDVLIPKMRDKAEDTRARITELAEEFRPYAGAWELPEGHDEATARMRELEERVLRG